MMSGCGHENGLKHCNEVSKVGKKGKLAEEQDRSGLDQVRVVVSRHLWR